MANKPAKANSGRSQHTEHQHRAHWGELVIYERKPMMLVGLFCTVGPPLHTGNINLAERLGLLVDWWLPFMGS